MSEKMHNVSRKQGKPIEIADPFARRLIGKYLQHRRDDIGKLRQALSDSDFETIRITGHNLYGSGSAYGLDEISRLGENIERAADAKDGRQVQRLIDEMTAYLERLRVV